MDNFTSQNSMNSVFSDRQLTLDLSNDDLRKLVGWSTFKAVMDIIGGALACLGIITAAFGVPLIIAGVKLLKAVDEIKSYMANNDLQKISSALSGFHSFFKFTGISTIIQIILVVIGIIAYAALIAYLISNPGFMIDNFVNRPGL